MQVNKKNEKVLLWMWRNGYTQEHVAKELGITRQTFASRLKDNYFTTTDLMGLKRLGFE
jgi:DNA-binding XRE family transcriptional regulator